MSSAADPAPVFAAEQPVLHTNRLVLRPFTLADAPAVRELAGDARIADTTLTIPHPYPEGAAEVWIGTHHDQWVSGKGAIYAVHEREGDALVGAAGLEIKGNHARAELGYWVGVPYWNRGYCTEAAAALLELAFDTLRLHRVEAHHFVRNPQSGRVMQKIGMRHEGTARGVVRKGDRFEDLEQYAVLAADRAS